MKKLNTKTHTLSPIAALVATLMLSSGSLQAQTEVDMNIDLHTQTEAQASANSGSQQQNARVESDTRMSASANASVSNQAESEESSEDTRPPAREDGATPPARDERRPANQGSEEQASNSVVSDIKLDSSINSVASSVVDMSLESAEQPIAAISANLSQVTELGLDGSSRLEIPEAPDAPEQSDAPEAPQIAEQGSGSEDAVEQSGEQLVSAQAVVNSAVNATSDIAAEQTLPQAPLAEIASSLEASNQTAAEATNHISQQTGSLDMASQVQSVTSLVSGSQLATEGGEAGLDSVAGASNQNQLSNVSNAASTAQLDDAAKLTGQVDALTEVATITEIGADSLVAGAVDSTINSTVDGAINGVVEGTVNSTLETAIDAAVESTLDSTLESALGDIINP